MRSFPPEELYYITHIDNLRSILDEGILSHERIKQSGLDYTAIYDEDVVSIRKDKSAPNGKSLWHYANLYFQPRNPMMYSVVSAKKKDNLVVMSVSKEVFARRRCSYHGWQRRQYANSVLLPVRRTDDT